MQLTENFTLEEMIRSQVADELGIDNSIRQEAPTIRAALTSLCRNVLEPVRTLVNLKRQIGDGKERPVRVTSGYRCKALNLHPRIGGSMTSQHPKGEAADINVPGYTTQELFETIVAAPDIEFDQIIQEFDQWVHISRKLNGTNRRQVLYAYMSDGGKKKYSATMPAYLVKKLATQRKNAQAVVAAHDAKKATTLVPTVVDQPAAEADGTAD